MSLVLAARTAWYLRPSQLAWRLLRRFPAPSPDRRPPPPLRSATGPWPERPHGPAALLDVDRVRIHGVERTVGGAHGWDDPRWPHLWRYHLHYHDDLVAAGWRERRGCQLAFIDLWLVENPPGTGSAWDPYPVSRRLLNWSVRQGEGGDLSEPMLASFAMQARWLRSRFERHLGGNHLLTNAMALAASGLVFAGVEGETWWREGATATVHLIADQVLPDGGHDERSAMYQAIILEDLLRLIALARRVGVAEPKEWRETAGAMSRWLQAMTHPDGGIVQFNDAALDQALPVTDLLAWATRLGISWDAFLPPLLLLKDSGYVRAECGDATLFVDVAPLGPDHQPGHGHADTLTCELSVGGRRVLVDSGTSEYGLSAERLRQRGTAAHNTVVVDGADSSEVWHGFRVARRAYPSRVVARSDEATRTLVIEAAHDGYRRLRGVGLHHRRYVLGAGRLLIEDRIDGKGVHEIEVTFLFHPTVAVRLESGMAVLSIGSRELRLAHELSLTWTVEPATWHPGFGRVETTRRLIGRARLPLPAVVRMTLSW